MPEERPFDLYEFVHRIVEAGWIEGIHIFGSRRYLSNASYGSDIDLLVIPNKQVPTDALRKAVDHRYVDAFLLDSGVAISAGNETRIQVGSRGIENSFDSVQIWTRAEGWKTGNDYRILNILPDRTPAMTIGTGARPTILFCALESEFAAVVNRLPPGKQTSHPSLPTHYATHLKCASGRKRLVVAVQTGVASVKAGIAATRIFDYFDQPKITILVGITAGLKGRGTALGDVLVPTGAVDVESGKVTPKGKEPSGPSIETSPNHRSAIALWPGLKDWAQRWEARRPRKATVLKLLVDCAVTSWPGLKDWAQRWEARRPERATVSKLLADCTIACTASVIAYDGYAQKYRSHNRKIAGIEMEAIGVGFASLNVCCPFIIVKSISDWADEKKDDMWHQYCMDSVADLVISMLEDETL
jgi:nucleoside phosphorylase